MDNKAIIRFKDKYFKYLILNSDKVSKQKLINDVLLSSFFTKFSINKLKDMEIDDYCFAKGNRNSFCYWFDYQLNSLCDIHIQYTGAFQKYHIQKNLNGYLFLKSKQKVHPFGTEPHEIFNNLQQEIIRVAKASLKLTDKNIDLISKSKLHESFKAKITYVYAPNNWVPVLVNRDVNFILEWFGVDSSSIKNLTLKRKALFEIYKKIKENGINLTTWEFIRFFYCDEEMKCLLHPSEKKETKAKTTSKTSKTIFPIVRIDVENIEVKTCKGINVTDEFIKSDESVSSDEDFERSETVKKCVGHQGEEIVYKYLHKHKKTLNIKNIKAPCLEGKNNIHYDISFQQDNITHFIEVKSSGSLSNNSIYLEISKNEYLFLNKHLEDNLYHIYFVNNVFGTPSITIIHPKFIKDNLKAKVYYLRGGEL